MRRRVTLKDVCGYEMLENFIGHARMSHDQLASLLSSWYGYYSI